MKQIARISGSSLIELVVAMALMAVVFSVSAAIVANVGRAGFSGEKFGGMAVINEVATETQKAGTYFPEQLTRGIYTVVKSVDFYEGNPQLALLKIEVYGREGHLMAVQRQLIQIRQHE
nr:hypothetical protein [uncultured Dyadobacter sp.]